jgi:hypothetical protein
MLDARQGPAEIRLPQRIRCGRVFRTAGIVAAMRTLSAHTVSLALLLALLSSSTRAQSNVELQLDLEADELFRRCQGMVGEDKTAAARACFEQVIEQSPESTAALKARAAIATLDARVQVERSTWERPSESAFKPGRLELSITSGAFGIWTGAALASFVGTRPGILPVVASVTGGAVAVGLGGGFLVGSYLLGEFLELKAGTSRLIASGMGWGTLFGLSLAPWVFALQGTPWPPGGFVPDLSTWQTTVPPVLLVSALTGWMGLGVSSGLALVLDLDPGQVAVVNTGALVGTMLGATFYPLLGAGGIGHPAWLGLLTLTTGGLGLLGGFGMSQLVELSTWEVVIIDALTMAVFGLSAAGAVGVSFVTNANIGVNVLLGGVAGVATTTTLVASTVVLGFMRVKRDERLSRVGFLPVDSFFAPGVALDREQRAIPTATYTLVF